jgi:glycosyltransferase involved in cell wall biosynthesis
MRIGIDARFYGSLGKGLGRYTQKLIEYLEKIDNKNQYFIFMRKDNWEEYQPKRNNFTKIMTDIPWYSLREQIFFPKILNGHKLDLVHFPHFNVPYLYKGKFVVTIHDLILFRFPTKKATTLSPFLYFFKRLGYRAVINRAVGKAKAIIAVSNYTKKDILENFKIDPQKIFVTHEAADKKNHLPDMTHDEILKRYAIIKPYILYVGNAYPHKNLERLVTAFQEAVKKHPGLHLVMVGKDDYFYQRLGKIVKNNNISNIIFTGEVEDKHLGLIYRESKLYVFPSLYEGFGLPPLEAMHMDIPVICSNSSCLPEILGNAAYYFDPRGTSEISDSIDKVITDTHLRQKLIENGQQQVRKYSWIDLAKKTLDIYQENKK